MTSKFLERFYKKNNTTTNRDDVKQRLKVILAKDRILLSQPMIEKIKVEMTLSISKLVELDSENTDIYFDTEDRTLLLKAKLPIKRVLSETNFPKN